PPVRSRIRGGVATMKIGIIGAGNIGSTAARLFVRAGHEGAVSNSRGPDSLQALGARLRPCAPAPPVHQAPPFGAGRLPARPWRSPEARPSPAAVHGRIVVDAMNPYREGFHLFDLGDSTSSEVVQQRLPGARLVKAFNTIYFAHLATRGRTDLPLEDRHAIFLAGADAEAKAVVAQLIEDIGFAPIDTGPLREGGRRQQPGAPVYNRPMTGREARAALAREQP